MKKRSRNQVNNFSVQIPSTLISDETEPPPSNLLKNFGFQMRTCTTFIPQETNSEFCVCNRRHGHDGTSKADQVWVRSMHTKLEPTTYYGKLPQSNRHYLRCDIDTDLDLLCRMLLEVWCLPLPKLIIHMMPGSSSKLSVKLEEELLRGILAAAIASNTISSLIGEMIFKNRLENDSINFSAIGVGKWGNIRECHDLDQRGKDQIASAKYTLESHHTHYIFFDDGTYNSIDTGEFTSKLARHLSHRENGRIPLVTLLIGGGLHALQTVYDDLTAENIPVVIVNQSGSLANTLCKRFKSTENTFESIDGDDSSGKSKGYNNKSMLDQMFRVLRATAYCHEEQECSLREILHPFGKMGIEIINDVRKFYGNSRKQESEIDKEDSSLNEQADAEANRELGEHVVRFVTCLTPPFRSNIHIYDVNSSISLQNTIYDALVQASNNISQLSKQSMSAGDKIRQSVRWCLPDASWADLVIDWNETQKIDSDLVLDALSKNLPTVISNFVKLGIDFTTISFADSIGTNEVVSSWNCLLKDLYSVTRRKNPDPLYLLDQMEKKFNFENETDLNDILVSLVGDFMLPLYNYGSLMVKMDAEHTYRDLFLWCVLTHRLEIAKIFLNQMHTRICSALIASKILRSLKAYAPDNDSKVKLESEANDFEMYAIQCVRCCYQYDRQQTCELIIRRLNLYGDISCLQVAVAADDKQFLYEDACYTLLSNIWFDKVDHAREQIRLLVNLLTMGVSQIIFSIYDKHEMKGKAGDMIECSPPKRRLAKESINYTDDYDLHAPIIQHFSHFHNRPVVKYCYNCVGYIIFLLFFSYFILFAFDPLSTTTPAMHWTEILTIIIVTSMLIEDIRQFLLQDSRTLKGKLKIYFDLNNRFSNLCVVLPAYVLFYVGLILRCVLQDIDVFSAARIVLAYDLELWFIRSILFIGIFETVGPKLVMIRKMVNDLQFFIFLIIIVILGYGITSRAMIAYGEFGFDGRQILYHVVYPVYYFVLGRFDNELSNLDETPNASTTIATQIMFAFHMLFVNILLVNLLIAMFTFTTTQVQDKANYIWAYDRCVLIREYYTRPALFPPLTLIISLIRFCRWCWYQCRGICSSNEEDNSEQFQMISDDPNIDIGWSEFEQYSTNDYVRKLLNTEVDTTISAALPSMMSERYKSSTMDSTVSDIKYKVELIDRRLKIMEEEMSSSLDWMMMAMARVRMAATSPPIIGSKPAPLRSAPVGLNSRWTNDGLIVAGGNGKGHGPNQLDTPQMLYVDEDQNIYIADNYNHRIIEWKFGATSGQVVAGGNGRGKRSDQLNCPMDVIVDKENDCFIISDTWNRRIVRWPRRGGKSGETIISGIGCHGLTMDDRGFLYICDESNHDVSRWKIGETEGKVVAGGNGAGDGLNQLNSPIFVFVDRDYSVYVSDFGNHRVMKWLEGASNGLVVANGNGYGPLLSQLTAPAALAVDQLGTIYIVDLGNNRIMRWPKGAKEGTIVVGGNGQGTQVNQLNTPQGLSFDRYGNLYVVDSENHRVLKFFTNRDS